MSLSEKIRERKLDRMRAGQAVCEFVTLLSDPEIRVAIVPLTEAELESCIEAAANIGMQNDNTLSLEYRERVQTREIVYRAVREDHDLSKLAFESSSAMAALLDAADINHVFDHYLEMVDRSSPSIDGVPEEEFENLKVTLQAINWNELSGKQWYAAKRFLSSISTMLLRDSSFGSSSNSQWTKMSEEETLAWNASERNETESASLAEKH